MCFVNFSCLYGWIFLYRVTVKSVQHLEVGDTTLRRDVGIDIS